MKGERKRGKRSHDVLSHFSNPEPLPPQSMVKYMQAEEVQRLNHNNFMPILGFVRWTPLCLVPCHLVQVLTQEVFFALSGIIVKNKFLL